MTESAIEGILRMRKVRVGQSEAHWVNRVDGLTFVCFGSMEEKREEKREEKKGEGFGLFWPAVSVSTSAHVVTLSAIETSTLCKPNVTNRACLQP